MGRAPPFLAREGYRRRRLADMARLLPLVGLALFLMPALDARDGLSAPMLIYLFGAWAGLITVSAILARRLCRSGAMDDSDGPQAEGP
ncbi:hypothetical protein [Rhodovulum euryhalinum]|uniref:Uncharacterized protein n=1 Tax=Rhodovulum euryhalinum TaxID=35805 RepID=A0A4R2KEQ8_9RHOB|nr:hypothetical protein EV655_12314 [Rhodovulum euryhalinum]